VSYVGGIIFTDMCKEAETYKLKDRQLKMIKGYDKASIRKKKRTSNNSNKETAL
jgi:hypothetical protein